MYQKEISGFILCHRLSQIYEWSLANKQKSELISQIYKYFPCEMSWLQNFSMPSLLTWKGYRTGPHFFWLDESGSTEHPFVFILVLLINEVLLIDFKHVIGSISEKHGQWRNPSFFIPGPPPLNITWVSGEGPSTVCLLCVCFNSVFYWLAT